MNVCLRLIDEWCDGWCHDVFGVGVVGKACNLILIRYCEIHKLKIVGTKARAGLWYDRSLKLDDTHYVPNASPSYLFSFRYLGFPC